MKADYSKMTDIDFDIHLDAVFDSMSRSEIRAMPGVESILREELNNRVLESWERANPKIAFPNDNESDSI